MSDYTEEEAKARMDAMLKQALHVTGPAVRAVDLPNGRFRVEVDFDRIVKRGRDSDTHPKDGDGTAPLVSGAGRQASPK